MASIGSGTFFYVATRIMTNLHVNSDGQTFDACNVLADPIDPATPIHTQRAVVSAVRNAGKTTRLDVVFSDGLTIVDYVKGETLYALVNRSAGTEIALKMVAEWDLFQMDNLDAVA